MCFSFLIHGHIPILPVFVGSVSLAPTQHEEPKIANSHLSTSFEKMLNIEHLSHFHGLLVVLLLKGDLRGPLVVPLGTTKRLPEGTLDNKIYFLGKRKKLQDFMNFIRLSFFIHTLQ